MLSFPDDCLVGFLEDDDFFWGRLRLSWAGEIDLSLRNFLFNFGEGLHFQNG